MGRMNVYLTPEEDSKLERLKTRFKINSKEEVIKRLIKQFPETKSELEIPETNTKDFNFDKELKDTQDLL